MTSRKLGCVTGPNIGLSPKELADCVIRTLVLPEIETLRPRLLAGFPVYSAHASDDEEIAMVGIADALTLNTEGLPAVIVDWKSDVNRDP